MTDFTPILQAARQAVQVCQLVQQKHIVHSEKAGREPVTLADYGSQAVVCRAIQQHFPDYAIIAEESGKDFRELLTDEQRVEISTIIGDVLGETVSAEQVANWLDHGKNAQHEFTWVIDPIDGTKGFLDLRHYVVAIGLLQNRQPVGGILAAPEYPGGGALLYAFDDKAYKEPINGGEAQQIRVSSQSDPAKLRALESVEKSHSSFDRMGKVRQYAGLLEDNIERMDSQEKYGRLADGLAEVYLRLPHLDSNRKHSIWDHAAGTALVVAAGGKVTDVDGSPLDYSEGTTLKNHGVVASNGPLHDKIIEALQQLAAEEIES